MPRVVRITMSEDAWGPILLPDDGHGDEYDVSSDVLERFQEAWAEFDLALDELHDSARRASRKRHHR